MPSLALLALALIAPEGEPILERPVSRPSYAAAAHLRIPIAAGQARHFVTPVGLGFGADAKIHPFGVFKTRLGFWLAASHDRFFRSLRFERVAEDGSLVSSRRFAELGQTLFSLGPSWEIPLAPVVLTLGVGVGGSIASYVRPTSHRAEDNLSYLEFDPSMSARIDLCWPLRPRAGLLVGVGLSQTWSDLALDIDSGELAGALDGAPNLEDPLAGTEGSAFPFHLLVQGVVGWQAWF